ncbi:uncharacterized protein LOC127723874 [Mytilus californianus]|uniref:uncharacterized protein LOC127723874 n=1 Tax=Mytilus californianus TaxID=6549 RepID=UPI0022473974|nr:uncharacterized protein LOC127723874 [Mytilus californianus]
MIDDVVISKSKQILSGSLAEGLNLPSSDLDIMFVTKTIDVIENLRNIKHTLQRTTLVMETDTVHPGFARLSLLPRRQGESDLSESIKNNRYLSVKEFLNVLSKQYRGFKFVQHGPCLSDKNQNFDFAFCLRSKYLPYIAVPWSWRYRHQWPPNYVINKIKNNGCLLVPIGPKNVSNCNFLWRLSFSVAEKHLVHSFNFTQLLCYGLLKLTLKHIVNTNDHAKDLLCSYFLKTALFWVSEEVDIDTFKLSKLFFCFSLCLNKLISWVKNCHCPNYFIPENNMFLGKITLDNNRILLHVLDSLQLSGIDGLINTLFPRRNRNDRLLYSNSETSFIMQDFLFYRICELCHSTDISHCYKVRTIIECLLKSESSLIPKELQREVEDRTTTVPMT